MIEDANWSLIPKHCRNGMIRWIMYGTEPGNFLGAVLENDLRRAVERADDINRASLANYVTFLFNYAPLPCWGSPEKVAEWKRLGGLKGQAKVAANPELSMI